MKPQDIFGVVVQGGLRAVNMVAGVPGKVFGAGRSGETAAGRAADTASPPLANRAQGESQTATAQRAREETVPTAAAAKARKAAARKPAAKKPAAKKAPTQRKKPTP